MNDLRGMQSVEKDAERGERKIKEQHKVFFSAGRDKRVKILQGLQRKREGVMVGQEEVKRKNE